MKKLKIMFVSGLAVLALCFGFFLPVAYVSADEVSETSEISAEIGAESLESVESVETPAESESVENPPVLDEEKQDSELTLDELAQMVGDYLASKKTDDGGFDFWAVFKDIKTWVIAGVGALGSIALSAIFAAILGHFRNKGVINTEKNVETIAAKAAADAVKGIVGNSINLDISAEVNKAVEKFMYSIKNELDSTFDMAKNTEILTAEIAQALSKSRVLTKEEQNQLHADADAVMAHAQKGGAGIKAPAAVVVKEDTKTVDNQATVQKTDTKTDVKPENGYTLNFGGV